MRKTYKNQLPKGMEVDCTMVRVENGQIVVDVDFKEKFQPEEGDFLVDEDGCVFICSRPFSDYYGCYAGSYCDGTIHAKREVTWVKKSGCRYATPEEKADFLERLEKERHKRWNAEKKCLEDIRWRAEKGESYYYISTALGIDISKDNDVRGDFSEMRHKSNNYFRTHKAAQEVADQIKEIFKNSKAE